MNQHSPIATLPPGTTMAAETMPRRAWTVAEIEAMVAAGIIAEDERFELIGGEVVPMAAKGARHEVVKIELNLHLQSVLSRTYRAAPETTLRLDAYTFLEPDFCVYPAAIRPNPPRGSDVLLAIEVANTSLRYDLGRKTEIYATFGIPEVWVINARTLETRVHRDLGEDGYRTQLTFGPDETVRASMVEITMRLSDFELDPLKGADRAGE